MLTLNWKRMSGLFGWVFAVSWLKDTTAERN